jgi:hypothetical protein
MNAASARSPRSEASEGPQHESAIASVSLRLGDSPHRRFTSRLHGWQCQLTLAPFDEVSMESGSRFIQAVLNSRQNLVSRREDPEHGEGSGVDNDIVVHPHFELAVAPVDHLDVGFENPSKMGCHTDSLDAGHSNDAVANADSAHTASRSSSARRSSSRCPSNSRRIYSRPLL